MEIRPRMFPIKLWAKFYLTKVNPARKRNRPQNNQAAR
jgi:hypothetical protein